MFVTKCVCRVLRFDTMLLKSQSFLKCTNIIKAKNFRVVPKNAFYVCNRTFAQNKLPVKSEKVPKKRIPKKKKLLIEDEDGFKISAFSTAEEYNLENLAVDLPKFTMFKTSSFGSDYGSVIDVVHAQQKSETELKDQDLFFFRNGCIVIWNSSDIEIRNILKFLKHYEGNSFNNDLITNESEVLFYSYSDEVAQTQICSDSLLLPTNCDVLLEKYAVSNALALSVHLGAYEANLERYVETMKPVTDDLKAGNKIKMSRSEVLQKTGQLFALRHNISLNSDLLDTPDFYWDREELENVYQATINYYCINKRTKVINEKINHCIELVELLSSHLSDKHHVRLEWMIIILIMVEVAFEVCHYLERYVAIENK